MITIDGTRVDAFGSTDAGKIRPGNQDHYLIATLRRILEIEATSIPLGTSQRFGQCGTGGRVDAALDAGGSDNVTMIAARFV